MRQNEKAGFGDIVWALDLVWVMLDLLRSFAVIS